MRTRKHMHTGKQKIPRAMAGSNRYPHTHTSTYILINTYITIEKHTDKHTYPYTETYTHNKYTYNMDINAERKKKTELHIHSSTHTEAKTDS